MSPHDAWWRTAELAVRRPALDGLGLRDAAAHPAPEELEGFIGGASIRVTFDPLPHVLASASVPGGVSLGSEPTGYFAAWKLGADFLTGDPAFDDAVRVHGPPSLVLALLDLSARARMKDLVQRGFEVADGRVRWDALGPTTEEELAMAVHTAAQCARELSLATADEPTRLASNLEHESVAAVRLRIVQVLGKEHSAHPVAPEALARASRDPSLAVRLAAIEQMSGEGAIPALRELVLDPGAPDDALAAAMHGLAPLLKQDELRGLVDLVLVDGSSAAIVVALQVAGTRDALPSPEARLALLGSAHPDIRAAAARSLDAVDARVERALAGLLDDDAIVVLAALSTLGRTGSISSVEAIRPLAARWLGAAEVQRAAAAALKGIQSRSGGSGGALSLAGSSPSAGALSVSHPVGALATPPDEE